MSPLHSFLVGICLLFLVFSIHLLISRGDKRKLTRFLSIVIISRIGQILLLLTLAYNLTAFPLIYKIVTAIFYLAPCCLYFYVKLFLNPDASFRTKNWLHFMPFGLVVIHFLTSDTIYPVNWDAIITLIKSNKNIFITERTGFLSANIIASLRIALMVSYLILCWKVLIKSKLFQQKKWTSNKAWIMFIVCGATIFQTVGISALFINYNLVSFPWFLAIHCFLLVILVLFLLHKPDILYGYLLINVNNNTKESPISKKKSLISIKSPIPNNNFGSDFGQKTVDQLHIEAIMESKKLFLNPNLQILDIANALNIPVHQCSATINAVIGKNFRDWCNSFRVKYFIEIYPAKRNLMTIESMANDSGFKSLTTFYNAFKKETGMMPKQYFKNTTIKGS